MENKSGYSLLLSAIESGNVDVYNRVVTELFLLNKQGLIDDQTYIEQFTKADNNQISPMIHAVKSGDMGIYSAYARKLKRLHKEKRLSDDSYVLQFIQPQFMGFSPLLEAAFTGKEDILRLFADNLKDALCETSQSSQEADTKFAHELLVRSDENFNIFHCATWVKREKNTPNPFLVETVLDLFYETFDGETARKHIQTLYREQTRTEFFDSAYHEAQPYWLKQILSLSEERPILPLRSINH